MSKERAQEYRRQAQECLAVARTVSNPQGRASLETLAQMWFRLADKYDPPKTRTAITQTEPLPAVQQQQPQPRQDGDSDKE